MLDISPFTKRLFNFLSDSKIFFIYFVSSLTVKISLFGDSTPTSNSVASSSIVKYLFSEWTISNISFP